MTSRTEWWATCRRHNTVKYVVERRLSVVIVVESPFGDYDTERYRVSELCELVDLTILDLTPLLKPEYWRRFGSRSRLVDPVQIVESIEGLEQQLFARHWDAWIDEIGLSGRAHRIRSRMGRSEAMRVWLRLGLLPGDSIIESDVRQLFRVRLSQRGFPRMLWGMLVHLPRRLVRRTRPPEVVLGSGSYTASEASDRSVIIWAHSFDLEKARRVSTELPHSPRHGIVFLDQNLGLHPDRLHSGLKSPVDHDRYHRCVCQLFDRVERLLDNDVEVALHPKSSLSDPAREFGGRVVSRAGAQHLVHRSSLVLCHASASLSFAVIWRRPVLFLTSMELEKSWYRPHIAQMAALLRRPTVFMDGPDAPSDEELSSLCSIEIDEEAYSEYEERFIRSRWSPDRPLWETFAYELRELTRRR